MNFFRSSLMLSALGALCAMSHCAGDPDLTMRVDLLTSTGAAAGSGTFVQKAGAQEVQLNITVTGLPAGKHGVHIHETGVCTAPDFMSAGAHFNPSTQVHGDPAQTAHHAGDLGNLEVSASGTGTLQATSTSFSLVATATNYIGSRAFVVHQSVDDLMTQPSGNSGARIACGVIVQAAQ